MKYPLPTTVNVANFVTVKPSLKRDGISNFENWKGQMVSLLESQDVIGFVNGNILPPEKAYTSRLRSAEINQKLWRRTDSLIKEWILGSIGKDVLDAVREKETARDIWLELANIFKPRGGGKVKVEEVEEEEEEIEEDYSRCLPLYKAAQIGDWDTAKKLFRYHKEGTAAIISSNKETALHVAVLTGANDFVKKLLQEPTMTPDALAYKNSYGDTALHNAARVGNAEAAAALFARSPDLLLYQLNNDNRLPVEEAAINCQKDTLKKLISWSKPNVVNTPFEGQFGIHLLIAIIASEYVDVALDLVERYPKLALLTAKEDGSSALSTIAETYTLFPRIETFTWCQNFIYHRIPLKMSKREAAQTTSVAGDIENSISDDATNKNYSSTFQFICGGKVGQKVESMIWNGIEHLVPKVKDMREKKEKREQALKLVEYLCQKIVYLPEKEASAIFQRSFMNAAEYGMSEIVEMIIHNYPMVTSDIDVETGKNIFLLAASNRFENVINLLYRMSSRKNVLFDCTDNNGNNIMHICGILAPSHRLNLVHGAALQMQRELQWFKEMQKFVHPSRRKWPNLNNQTPQALFTKEHANLKADGERWMKETANACTISAALIATVVFAAALTVPGGVESGIPLFSGRPAFVLFAVSDAVSLFTSITSVLMFLSILTSRYAEEDFLYVLPRRLSIGLLSLFVSIISMMVAFSATLYLLLRGDGASFLVLVAVCASLPVAPFLLSQFPLLVDVIYSTYGPGIFGNKTGRLLY